MKGRKGLANLLAQLDPRDKKRKGDQFELICKWFLENDRRFAHLTQVWLWDDWPGNWGDDAGIDLVAQDRDGNLWAIQAKAYSDKYWITKHDVDTFLSESGRPGFTYRLLIGTTNRIRRRSEQTLNEQAVPSAFFGLSKLEAAQVNWPNSMSDLLPPPPEPKEPRDYQIEAINAVVDGFETSDRGQMIMACGTGKTLTALFVKEKLSADRTLVLAPSLSLLDQTIIEWTANATTAFEHQVVCSDEKVGNDSIVVSAAELGDVTTDPVEIARFLRGKGPRVVFATYQSSPEIAKAFELGRVKPFDLVVADEAHRTVGRKPTAFSTVLDDEKIKAKRRLFMTATPRFVPGSVIGEIAALGREATSMDDEAVYGPVFHCLPFSEAIERGLLTDYQVVVIGVDDVMCRALTDNARFVESDGIRNTDARTLAAQIGLAKAMNNYDMRRAISFHSRVEGARQFSHSLAEVISWMPDDQRPSGEVWANYVSGEMPANRRRVRIEDLRTVDTNHRGLLSNARCLTEGVDVPTLDGVVFVDPKRSEVDIVQAVGRAIRLAPDKTVGTIVIPVFMASGDDHEAILDDSSFKTVWEVIKALRMHDEQLAEYLDSLRLGLGQRGAGDPRPEKIHLNLPAHIGAEFARAFDVRLVSSVTASFMEWLGRLQTYYEATGTTWVPQPYKTPDGHALGRWVHKQRALYRRGKVSADRIELLGNLGDWTWELSDAQFEKFVEELRKYYADNKTVRVEQNYKTPDGYRLGMKVAIQRGLYSDGKLSADRIKFLESIGHDWTWNTLDANFEKFVEELRAYYEVHKTMRVTQSHKTSDGYALGVRLNGYRHRYKQGKLSANRIETLESIGHDWTWEPNNTVFEEFVSQLQAYYEVHKTMRIEWDYTTPDGYPLGARLKKVRSKRATLSANRIEILENIGHDWTWNTLDDTFEKLVEELRAYYAIHKTTRVKKDHTTPDGYPLGMRVAKVRNKKGKLSADRIEILEGIGHDWVWNTYDAAFEKLVEELRAYYAIHKTTRVETDYVTPDGYTLGRRLGKIRYRKSTLSAERIKALESVGHDWTWNAKNDASEEFISQLRNQYETHGTVRVKKDYTTPDGYPLGMRIAAQRVLRNTDKMSADRIELLENIGDWTWNANDAAFDDFVTQLREHYAIHKTVQVKHAYETPDGYPLGTRLTMWRSYYRKGELSAERLEKLNSIDPTWSAPR